MRLLSRHQTSGPWNKSKLRIQHDPFVLQTGGWQVSKLSDQSKPPEMLTQILHYILISGGASDTRPSGQGWKIRLCVSFCGCLSEKKREEKKQRNNVDILMCSE